MIGKKLLGPKAGDRQNLGMKSWLHSVIHPVSIKLFLILLLDENEKEHVCEHSWDVPETMLKICCGDDITSGALLQLRLLLSWHTL